MSHVASTACYRLVMPGVAKNVLLAMADMANDDLFCWPSIETICTRTCWSRRSDARLAVQARPLAMQRNKAKR